MRRTRRAKRNSVIVGIIVVVAGVIGAWYLARPQPTDEEQIDNLVAQAQHAVNQRNVRGFMKLIAKDYMDSEGNDRPALTRLMIAAARSGEQVRVSAEINQLQIHGDQATAEISAIVWFGNEEGATREPFRANVRFRREGRHWLIASAGYNLDQLESRAMDE